MHDHAHIEMRVWIGFAVAFSAAFLVDILGRGRLTSDQAWAIWTVAMSAGFINHGIWHRERIVILSGSLGIVVAVLSLAFAPIFFPVVWIIIGCGMAVSGFYSQSRNESLIGVYVVLGGIIQLLSVYFAASALSALLVWMVLTGLIFITVGMETRNPVTHLLGTSWILVSVASYVFYPEAMLLSLMLVFVVGMIANFVYLYKVLGRTPKIGEIISFATRALFLKGLKKPIDQYRVLAILLKGDMAAENTIRDLLSRLEPRCAPILLLGPTAPTQLSLHGDIKVGWVATVSGVSKLNYPLLPPEDPTSVSVFLAKALSRVPEGMTPVILGDFLDNMIPHMDESALYGYYSDLASAARVKNHTLVLVVSADVHDETEISVVKRFADVIIENREREERGRLIREVRVSNRVDNMHTNWERYLLPFPGSRTLT